MNQNKNLVNLLELVTREEARVACKLDAPQLSSNVDKFVNNNVATWYVATNVWLLMLEDASRRTAVLVKDMILRKGLLYAIDTANNAAQRIIDHETIELDGVIFSYLLADLGESAACRNSEFELMREALFLLRFLKRISPNKADLVREKSIQKFLERNDKNRRVQNTIQDRDRMGFPSVDIIKGFNYDHFLLSDACKYCSEILHDAENQLVESDDLDIIESDLFEKGHFSAGTTREGYTCEAEKVKDMLRYVGNNLYNTPLYPIKIQGDRQVTKDYTWRSQKRITQVASNTLQVSVKAVPKSATSARIIAEESSYRAYLLQGLLSVVAGSINSKNAPHRDSLVLNDQEPNRIACRVGSITLDIATIDLSSASDSIWRNLGLYMMPRKIRRIISYLRATKLEIDGNLYSNYIFLTSGNPVTFALESTIFLSLALALWAYLKVFEPSLKKPRTFGDDLEVDSRMFDAFCELLESFGFEVNGTKSYCNSNYRESCGEEYLNGYPLHSAKWPRHTYGNLDYATDAEVSSLIDLQHSIFERFNARLFLTMYVRQLRPSMTSSRPYTECTDLWDDYPELLVPNKDGIVGGAPIGLISHIVDDILLPCEEVEMYSPRTKVTASKSWLMDGYHKHVTKLTAGMRIVHDDGVDRVLYGREYHQALCSVSSSNQKVATADLPQDVQMYLYTDFLRKGPRYSDGLDKLLGITCPRDYATFFGSVEPKYARKLV